MMPITPGQPHQNSVRDKTNALKNDRAIARKIQQKLIIKLNKIIIFIKFLNIILFNLIILITKIFFKQKITLNKKFLLFLLLYAKKLFIYKNNKNLVFLFGKIKQKLYNVDNNKR